MLRNKTKEVETAAVLRGTVKVNNWGGVTVGSVDAATRVVNGLKFQEALQYAYDNKKFFEFDPDTIEIDLAGGVNIPYGYNGFKWRGSQRGSIIVQYANNTPVLLIGEVNSSTHDSSGVDVEGVTLLYGNDQTGNTSAAGLKIGRIWKSRFAGIEVAANGSAYPYYSCHIAGSSYYFSNKMENCSFRSALQTSLYVNNFGTGNVFSNIYVTTGGAPTAVASGGPIVYFNTGGGAQYENVIDQLNVEWGIGSTPIYFNTCRNMSLISTHIEGCRLNAANSAFIKGTGSQINFSGLTFLNCGVKTADGAATKAYMLYGDYRSQFNVDGMVYWQDNVSYAGTEIPLYLFNDETATPYRESFITVDCFHISDNKSSAPTMTQFGLSDSMTDAGEHIAKGVELRISHIENNSFLTFANGGFADIADEDKTLYGFVSNMLYALPAALAADRSITLSNRMGPTGTPGENIPLPPGRMLSVTRSGTASGSDGLVKNHDGTLLATLSTSNQQENFYFDGTNWNKV